MLDINPMVVSFRIYAWTRASPVTKTPVPVSNVKSSDWIGHVEELGLMEGICPPASTCTGADGGQCRTLAVSVGGGCDGLFDVPQGLLK
jgi:hypothetical protein